MQVQYRNRSNPLFPGSVLGQVGVQTCFCGCFPETALVLSICRQGTDYREIQQEVSDLSFLRVRYLTLLSRKSPEQKRQ